MPGNMKPFRLKERDHIHTMANKSPVDRAYTTDQISFVSESVATVRQHWCPHRCIHSVPCSVTLQCGKRFGPSKRDCGWQRAASQMHDIPDIRQEHRDVAYLSIRVSPSCDLDDDRDGIVPTLQRPQQRQARA